MKNQDTLKTDWKYLIILDACRYDYFEKNHSRFIQGKLERRRSPATYTQEWLQKTFPNYYPDIIYISPIFFCNSIKSLQKNGFNGREHFYKISDAWEHGWDEEYGTVPPWYIYRNAILNAMAYPNKKIVIHFFQPHAPYLSIKPKQPRPRTHTKENTKEYIQIKKTNTLLRKLSSIYHRMFGTENLWRLTGLLGMETNSNMEQTWRRIGRQGIQQAYEKNLCTALFFVEKLTRRLPSGKIIVTADHGELLGEKKYWGHGPPKPYLPELTDVPWLEVERKK